MPKIKVTKRTAGEDKKPAGGKKRATKRKQQSSGDEEQRSSKKQGMECMPKNADIQVNMKTTGVKKKAKKHKQRSSGEEEPGPSQKQAEGSKVVRVSKTENYKPLTASVTEHIQGCIETAMLSVLSRKLSGWQSVQEHLTPLKQRLLQHCKTIKAPSTKLGNLKCLLKEIAEEQCRIKANEAALTSLVHELDMAVETAQRIEEEIVPLQEKFDRLKGETMEDEELKVNHTNADILQLPKASFQAPTVQENVRLLKNPELLLKELCLLESTPAAMDMRKLIEECYRETDALTVN
ncbi:centromere protein Q isoform 3-T4 [Discoglossus pictus]